MLATHSVQMETLSLLSYNWKHEVFLAGSIETEFILSPFSTSAATRMNL